MLLALHGLKNCDSCHKARSWLDANALTYQFHDLRSDGLEAQDLDRWLGKLGADALLNRRSTTWRALSDGDRCNTDAAHVRKLLLTHPTLIKRPVLEGPGILQVGFKADQYAKLLPGGG